MKFWKKNITAFVCVLAMISCGGPGENVVFENVLYKPAEAGGFTIYSYGKASSVVSITNPWQEAGDVELFLFLSRGGESPPEGFRGAVAEAPLHRVVCMSTSYLSFIDDIGEIDAVKGVSGARYVSNDTVRARYERGEVRDVGYDNNVNYEMIASMRPDLVMLYGVGGANSAMTRKLDELGIQHIYIGDYLEQSPVGKAEWGVAFGEMFDKREEAVGNYTGVRERYDSLKNVVSRASAHRPVVMLNAPWRDTWYVPGDRSYMVRLINDAGGEYACKGVDSDKSRPLNAEEAYIYASRSDFWLNPGSVETMAEVVEMNPLFTNTPAVLRGNVYNATKRSTPGGGSDFWESGATRPDVVLMDMVKILRPELAPDHELYYFKKIE